MATNKINPPDISTLKEIPNVRYDSGARVVVGLEQAFQQGKPAIVKATGLQEEWFSCKFVWDAEEVMKKYNSGDYIEVQWFV